MNIPTELQYTKSHEWLKMEDGVAVVGLTDFAQHSLGDIVFVNLPQPPRCPARCWRAMRSRWPTPPW